MSQAIGAVKQDIKKVPMRYSRDTSHEDSSYKDWKKNVLKL